MIISWTPPSYDGGTPITGYIVETNDVPGAHWNSINVNGFSHNSKIKGLKESHSYRFRVAAENKVGVGPFSEPSNVKTTYGNYFTFYFQVCNLSSSFQVYNFQPLFSH